MKIFYLGLLLIIIGCSAKNKNKETVVDIDAYGNIKTADYDEDNDAYVLNPKGNINIIWDETNQDFKNKLYNIDTYGHAIIVLDSCEWIYFKTKGYQPKLKHSYNCKYCKNRK